MSDSEDERQSVSIRIAPLKGELNYAAWKNQLGAALVSKGLLSAIQPNTGSTDKRGQEKREKALGLIIGSLSMTVINNVPSLLMDLETFDVLALYAYLVSTYSANTGARKAALTQGGNLGNKELCWSGPCGRLWTGTVGPWTALRNRDKAQSNACLCASQYARRVICGCETDPLE
jgi:hypothetical protein